MKQKIAVFTGAGVSQESGIQTFRSKEDGVWIQFDPTEVATMQAWNKNPEKVLEFHNNSLKQFSDCKPNSAHFDLVKLEEKFDVSIITQNVDTLHEQAGSTKVIHIHGNISESKSSKNPDLTYPLNGDIKIGDLCELGSQLRHNTVLFGEPLPIKEFRESIKTVEHADILIIIGTSLTVYPAYELIEYFDKNKKIYIVNPDKTNIHKDNVVYIQESATIGTSKLISELL